MVRLIAGIWLSVVNPVSSRFIQMELSSRHLELDIRTAATAYCVQRNFRTGLSSLVHVNFPFRINEAEALLILKHFLQILNLFWWSAGLRDLLYLGGGLHTSPPSLIS